MKKLFLAYFSIILLFNVWSTTAVATQPQRLTLGIVPQRSVMTLTHLWQPVRTYLNEATPYEIDLQTTATISEFNQALAEQRYDFAYMNPHHYVEAHQHYQYRAIVKERNRYLYGIIVVSKESSVQKLEDLAHTKLAFPDTEAFAATLVPQRALDQANIPFTSEYLHSNHDRVFSMVAQGQYAAGGGIMGVYEKLHPNLQKQLRIVWQSKSYPSHLLATHARVSDEVAKKMTEALTNMSEIPEYQAIFDNIEFNGFIDTADMNWEILQKSLKF